MLQYPLKFTPILKEKIWGGKKLREVLHKGSENPHLGESWEISGVEEDISVVANGSLKGESLTGLLETYKGQFVGERLYKHFGNKFPLLIKFIDARTALSVQLHPDDLIAGERHDSFGKTEMWYIVQADKDAEINVGFRKEITREEYLSHLDKGRITDVLHFEKVHKGDSFFIYPGLVHAIGGGVLLAEIQQTSDITYRIYDWDRTDEQGNSRELHTELALDAIDFKERDDFRLNYSKEKNTSNTIARCQYFTTNNLPILGRIQKNYSELDSFVIFMCVEGQAVVSLGDNQASISKGETVLIPAANDEVTITSDQGANLLEVYVEI